MCGFVGWLNKSGLPATFHNTMQQMLKVILHRGPDDEGIWFDESAGLSLGFRRLAILDLSPQGHQPIVSACGRWVMVFNGEIYNHAVLRRELEEKVGNINWRGQSDSEVLLYAIATYGLPLALEKCVGMFAIGIWDRQDRTLTLVRDRVGEKPLYYGWVGDNFLFSSELSAFYRHPTWKGAINRDALSLLMRHNYIPAPYSIFSNIFKVKPGHMVTLSWESLCLHERSYWNALDVFEKGSLNLFEGTPEEAVEMTEKLLRQSLAGQMVADVPIGAFLSGGIDSSTVVALMQSMSTRPVRTFSIGFNEEGYNEAVHAKAVAQHLKTDHTELYVTPQEALDVIPRLSTIYSEPFSDSSQIPTFIVSRLARQSVTVCLSGDGGDELFSGYSRYSLSETLWRYRSLFPGFMRKGIASGLGSLSVDSWNNFLNPLLKMLPQSYRVSNMGEKIHKLSGILSLDTREEIYQKLISHWENSTELVVGAQEASTRFMREAGRENTCFVRQMMYRDLVSYLPDDILVKVDRASMANSLEARVPLLDHRLIEFSMSLPMNILRQGGQTKWPLRQILYRYVPQKLIDRPKMGFGVPIDQWLRGPLREWASTLLEPGRIEGFFDQEMVKRAWESHLSGKENLQYKLWNILVFQDWFENYKKIVTQRLGI